MLTTAVHASCINSSRFERTPGTFAPCLSTLAHNAVLSQVQGEKITFPIACDRKAAILHVQIWSTH
jgi:hypothetical protein